MFDIYVTYVDSQDKELLELVNSDISVYLHFFDMKTEDGKKKGMRIKRECAARKDPFVSVKEEDKLKFAFYSEEGKNAVQQLINWLNGKEK